MKTNVHFLSFIAQFFLEWKLFQTKVVEEIETNVLCSTNFSFHPTEKLCRLWHYLEKNIV